MNSRQRRKQRRRFRHVVPVANRGGYELSKTLPDMIDWCHRRYGRHGYILDWPEFCFPDEGRAMEFKLEWA